MSFRSATLVALGALALGSTAASAALVTVTSYEMNNGNGATQFTFGPNYFDFTYANSTSHVVNPNANRNGSSQYVPNNSAPKEALLSGGAGLLTDNTIPTAAYGSVTGANAGQYVGWKYQDPTILFHLTGGQSVSTISLYVAANTGSVFDGLVAAPRDVLLQLSNGSAVSYTQTIQSYLGSPNTSVITLTLSTPVSSNLDFSLTLNRGPLQTDGITYYNDHIRGYNPANPSDFSNCVGWCDPDLFADNSNAAWASGFRAEAAGGLTGAAPNTPFGLEPWILLSEVQFASAVPETSTWIMMIAGFAGLGFMGYRRKPKPAHAVA